MCPGWPPDVSVCWAHGLVFVVGARCSHVYCLPSPILLPHHYFSCSTCVPLVTFVCLPICPAGVCSPVLIRCLLSSVCDVWLCNSPLPACLLFPFGEVFVHFLFILLLMKTHSSCTWVLTSSLSSRSHATNVITTLLNTNKQQSRSLRQKS